MIEPLPSTAPLGDQHFARFVNALDAAGIAPPGDELAGQARYVFACSDYVARICQRWPELWQEMMADNRFQDALSDDALALRLTDLLADSAPTEEAMMAIIRRFRHMESVRIAWRESNHIATVENWCCLGLFQIYWNVHRGWLAGIGVTDRNQLFDARTNARAAYALYQRAGGWGPWQL